MASRSPGASGCGAGGSSSAVATATAWHRVARRRRRDRRRPRRPVRLLAPSAAGKPQPVPGRAGSAVRARASPAGSATSVAISPRPSCRCCSATPSNGSICAGSCSNPRCWLPSSPTSRSSPRSSSSTICCPTSLASTARQVESTSPRRTARAPRGTNPCRGRRSAWRGPNGPAGHAPATSTGDARSTPISATGSPHTAPSCPERLIGYGPPLTESPSAT